MALTATPILVGWYGADVRYIISYILLQGWTIHFIRVHSTCELAIG